MDLDAIAATLRDVHPFGTTVGVTLGALGEGTGTATLPAGRERENQLGDQHAGALFTVGDAAAEAAFAGAFAEDMGALTVVVAGAELTHLAPARGPVTAHATLAGDRQAVLDALQAGAEEAVVVAVSLRDADDAEVATMRVRWRVRLEAPAAE